MRTTPVPIRLDADLKKRLGRAAKKLGAHRSTIMRFAILNQLPEIEAGRITINSDAVNLGAQIGPANEKQ